MICLPFIYPESLRGRKSRGLDYDMPFGFKAALFDAKGALTRILGICLPERFVELKI